MKPLGTIEQELADCRAAFEGVEVGAWAWCCHDHIEIERLTELPESRIAYILANKAVSEQACRLRNFRPVRGQARAACDQARAAHDQARVARDQAWAAYNQARVAYDQAQAAYDQARVAHDQARVARDQAWAARDQAWAAYNQAWAAYNQAPYGSELLAQHLAEYPDSTWDGQSIFSKGGEEK